jgi:hypothetical protein
MPGTVLAALMVARTKRKVTSAALLMMRVSPSATVGVRGDGLNLGFHGIAPFEGTNGKRHRSRGDDAATDVRIRTVVLVLDYGEGWRVRWAQCQTDAMGKDVCPEYGRRKRSLFS